MAKRPDEAGELLRTLSAETDARIVHAEDGTYRIVGATGKNAQISTAAIRKLRAAGLLRHDRDGALIAAAEIRSWQKRQRGGEQSFRLQHGDVVESASSEGSGTPRFIELDESPVATLARRTGKDGTPFVGAHLLSACERLRKDFELGRLQPRVTANWSASVSDGRRDGGRGGVGDLTDMALAARERFDRAVTAVGPELSGVLIDVCCFLKGLEAVERERQWPSRAAKLVLKLALESLARHYGLTMAATGKARGVMRQWGTEDYRPVIR